MDSQDRFYLGSEMHTLDQQTRENLVRRLRQYLELQRVSLLIGNGASLPLGAPSIGNVRVLVPELGTADFRLDDEKAQKVALTLLDILAPPNSQTDVESVLGTIYRFLANLRTLPPESTFAINGFELEETALLNLEHLLKKWLFRRCHQLRYAVDPDSLKHHNELFRRLLLRGGSLPRIKVFTTNYDVLIEHALDTLGVPYFDGFVGTLQRSLNVESYNYDLFFPAEITHGSVRRVDRVLQLFKLHGSINWRRSASGHKMDVIMSHEVPQEQEYGDVMIYPSPLKIAEMPDIPTPKCFVSSHPTYNSPKAF